MPAQVRSDAGALASSASPHTHAIWGFAFGYFACYLPYSALTKVLSLGLAPALGPPLSGVAILPLSLVASVVGTFAVLSVLGWWRYAHTCTVFGRRWPRPTLRTFTSGLCTATIVVTTTLAYTFEGVSIVLAMVLMRGGVLVAAPLVDVWAHRKVRWFSWLALALSLLSLGVTLADATHYQLGFAATLDIALYLFAYFIRLQLMSRDAKSADVDTNRRFFVEEQMVATPTALGVLALLAAGLAPDGTAETLQSGFFALWATPALWALLAVGILSQGTGVFVGLILLEPHENSYCVPVNRASSVFAGVLATVALTVFVNQPPPAWREWVGAALLVAAIGALSVPVFRRA